MRSALLDDRWARPGGRFSTPTLVEDLLRLAAIERAVAHLVAGWTPKIPELDAKIAVGSLFEGHMGRAAALRHQALTLLERDDEALVVDPACIEPLRALDRADATPETVTAALLGDVRAFLRDRYAALAGRLDPMLDTRLLPTVRDAVAQLSADTTSIGTPLPDVGAGTGPRPAVRDALEAAWSADSGVRVRVDDVAWSPVDRVPVPARPAGRPRPTVGVRSHVRASSRTTVEDLAGELNDNVMVELCALELLCRCSYEHPGEPWSAHLAMARHAVDEARHAAIFRRLMVEEGIDESGLHQHGANYEYAYEFPECEPGGERELLWRLLILCTVLEALAIDKLPVEIGGRDWVGQVAFARALDYIAADELFHTENGLRLTGALCERLGLHPTLERELVHGRFFGRQRDVRQAYLDADPERAAAEIAVLEAPDPDGVPYESRTEVERRLRAGFTLDDCEQIERWQYNPIRHEFLDEVAGS